VTEIGINKWVYLRSIMALISEFGSKILGILSHVFSFDDDLLNIGLNCDSVITWYIFL